MNFQGLLFCLCAIHEIYSHYNHHTFLLTKARIT